MVDEINLKDSKKFEEKAAEIISKNLIEISKLKDKVVFAVPGGSSVGGILKNLSDKKIPWEKIHIFMVDERLVPEDHDEYNYNVLKNNLTDKLVESKKMPKENIHMFKHSPDIYDDGVVHYNEEIRELDCMIDFILLSAGEDGHIGSLFPNHQSIIDESRLFVRVHESPKPPKDRMSASRNLIKNSSSGLLIFKGKAKKDAWKKYKDSAVSLEMCPAKLINQIEKSYVIANLD